MGRSGIIAILRNMCPSFVAATGFSVAGLTPKEDHC